MPDNTAASTVQPPHETQPLRRWHGECFERDDALRGSVPRKGTFGPPGSINGVKGAAITVFDPSLATTLDPKVDPAKLPSYFGEVGARMSKTKGNRAMAYRRDRNRKNQARNVKPQARLPHQTAVGASTTSGARAYYAPNGAKTGRSGLKGRTANQLVTRGLQNLGAVALSRVQPQLNNKLPNHRDRSGSRQRYQGRHTKRARR